MNVTSRRGGLSSGTTAKCATGCMFKVTIVPDELLDTAAILEDRFVEHQMSLQRDVGRDVLEHDRRGRTVGLLWRSLSKLTGPVSSKNHRQRRIVRGQPYRLQRRGTGRGRHAQRQRRGRRAGSVFHSCKVGSCGCRWRGARGQLMQRRFRRRCVSGAAARSDRLGRIDGVNVGGNFMRRLSNRRAAARRHQIRR